MTASIELKNLTTGYRHGGNEKVVSRGLNATLNTGELTCLLGPNGAGKSTLLRTMCAFQPALSGTVEVMGHALNSYRQRALAELISVVLTDNGGVRNMTAFDVVGMGRSPYTGFWGRLGEKDRVVVNKCFQWVGIEPLKERKMNTLSDGECQKVMIAKALAQETPVLFLDEPTAYLDYPSKIQMLMLLHRLARTLKKTVFLSTHDLEHALQVADQIWLLDGEHGLTTGSPEDLTIEGWIEQYFNREGFMYDRDSGTFQISHETARVVAMQGDASGLDFRLCQKALIRNGILPVESTPDCPVAIRVPGDGTYRLMENGRETYNVKRIEHLLRTVVPAIVKNQIAAIREAADLTPYE
ncbi:MAG: ABC transporter ATP-binding protein [Bacteroidaceae bacterium]|nr:ABC transporter ATP-binding protein [Bacteroidaceae bacterium]